MTPQDKIFLLKIEQQTFNRRFAPAGLFQCKPEIRIKFWKDQVNLSLIVIAIGSALHFLFGILWLWFACVIGIVYYQIWVSHWRKFIKSELSKEDSKSGNARDD
ncbi:MAG: hypothetical protein GJ680_19180 [Alteromonadaceae bacterium]|nr:hypothetical protein [Alteromonadaceae bacterium]